MPNGKLTIQDVGRLASGPVSYLLSDFIPERSIGILVGEWGIGKSPFALQLQLSLAANRKFLGTFTPARGNVRCLYVDLENGPQPVFHIITTLMDYIQAPMALDNFQIYSPNYGSKVEDLASWSEDHYIIELLKRDPVDFVIIDPLRMFKPDAEAKNSEAAAMLRGVRALVAQTNTSIMFVHHPRKISGDPTVERFHLETHPTEWMSNACGAAALVQNVDFRIGLEEDNERGCIVMRRFIRNRGWFPAEYVGRVFDDDGEPQGFSLEGGVDKLTPQERGWLASLPTDFSTKNFTFECRKHDQVVNRILKKMVSLAVIEKAGRGLWHQL